MHPTTRTTLIIAICLSSLAVMGFAAFTIREQRKITAENSALRSERDALAERVTAYRDYAIFLKSFYLPTNDQLSERGYRILQINNPLLRQKSEIRRIKKSADDLDDLWSRLRPLAETYTRDADTDLPIGAMLVVSAFYDYGNEPPNEDKSGCAGNGQLTDFKQVPELTFALHMQSDIGCCTDFTMLLGSFLEYLGYESEVMTNPAHQFLRVRIADRWDLIDATTSIYVRDYFSDDEKVIRSFAVGRDRVYPFKAFFEKALAFEIETYGPEDWEIRSREEQNTAYAASYLVAHSGGM